MCIYEDIEIYSKYGEKYECCERGVPVAALGDGLDELEVLHVGQLRLGAVEERARRLDAQFVDVLERRQLVLHLSCPHAPGRQHVSCVSCVSCGDVPRVRRPS